MKKLMIVSIIITMISFLIYFTYLLTSIKKSNDLFEAYIKNHS